MRTAAPFCSNRPQVTQQSSVELSSRCKGHISMETPNFRGPATQKLRVLTQSEPHYK